MGSSSIPEDVEIDNETHETEEGLRNPKGKRKEAPEKSGSSSKAKSARSHVWDHYTRLKENKDKCTCHYCAKIFACPTSSGTSNLQKHLNCCKQFKVWKENQTQTVLTNDGGNNLKVSKVSEAVFREASNEMLVLGELPLAFIEGVAWKHFTSKCNLYKPHSRRTATRDIYEMFVQRKTAMKKWIAASNQRVSLTTDIWVSHTTGASYMVITMHFIDANWHLRKLIIGFKYVTDHKGSTIASVLLECLDEWGIKKVFTITVDNATANSNALKKFERGFKLLGDNALVLDGEFLHMRCAAHIINLIVRDGLKEVDDNIEAIRNAVQYVRSSTNRLIAFDHHIESKKITRGSLPMDVKTRWNSTYLMLTKAQKYKLAFDKMEYEDKLYNDYFLEVLNGVKRIGPPTAVDWKALDRMVKFLVIFYHSTLVVSASMSVCSYKCYGEIVTIENNLKALSNSIDKELSSKALEMKDKFEKYWDGLKEINKLIIIASVFDPRKKMHFAQLCFDELYGKDSFNAKEMYDSVYHVLEALFKEYSVAFPKVPIEASSQSTKTSSFSGPENIAGDVMDNMNIENDDITGYKRMELRYNEMVDEKGLEDARDELEIYLKEKVENPKTSLFGDSYDVLSWWRQNSAKYPVLSEIARDVLAMQVSSVAAESAFSTSGRVLEPSRSSLNHYTLEVLMCTEQWMKSEIQLKDKGALTTSQLLADIELQDTLQKEFHMQMEAQE